MSRVLLVCAGLFVQSGRNAGAIDFGFRTDGLLVLSVDPLAQGYEPEQARALYRDIAADVAALPGVRSASWARRSPLAPGGSSGEGVHPRRRNRAGARRRERRRELRRPALLRHRGHSGGPWPRLSRGGRGRRPAGRPRQRARGAAALAGAGRDRPAPRQRRHGRGAVRRDRRGARCPHGADAVRPAALRALPVRSSARVVGVCCTCTPTDP